MVRRTCYLWIITLCLFSADTVRAQSELWLHVTDAKNADVPDVRFSYRGAKQLSPPTSDTGRTKLDLPAGIESIIYLTLHAPPNMRIALPLDSRVRVNASPEPEPVKILRRGERIVLGSEQMVTAIAYSVLRASMPESVELIGGAGSVLIKLRRSQLEAFAKDMELPQAEIEEVIAKLIQREEPFMRAVGAVYDGKHSEALEQLKRLATSPSSGGRFWSSSDVNFLAGQAHFGAGKFSDAAESFKQAVSAEPGNAELFEAYGLSLFGSKQFARSLEVWNKLLQLQPENKFLYLNQGLTFENMGQPLDSIKSFQNFLKRDSLGPISGNVYNYLGDAYFVVGKSREALANYRLSLVLQRAANDNAWQKLTFADRELYLTQPQLNTADYNEELLINVRQSKNKRMEAKIMSSMAAIYAQQGKDNAALDLYANAVKLAEESKSLSDAELLLVLKSYGGLLQKNNRTTDAARVEALSQTISERARPD